MLSRSDGERKTERNQSLPGQAARARSYQGAYRSLPGQLFEAVKRVVRCEQRTVVKDELDQVVAATLLLAYNRAPCGVDADVGRRYLGDDGEESLTSRLSERDRRPDRALRCSRQRILASWYIE